MTTQVIDPEKTQFPDNAIWRRDGEGTLLEVLSPTGKAVLWEKPKDTSEQSVEPKEVPATQSQNPTALRQDTIDQMRTDRASGMGTAELVRKYGVVKSTVQRNAPDINKTVKNQDIPSTIGNFSRLENRELPYSVQNAIQLSLNTVAQNAILAEERQVKSFFEGYLSGFTNALAIICGAGGIDLSFLEERNDTSTSNTQQ